jgi:hypothetical protein
MNLTGIQNVGEFYSFHYLDAVLEKDLKGLFNDWRQEEEDSPDKRLNRMATEYYQAKQRALSAKNSADAYQASHAFHVGLLEALGYQYQQGIRYLLDGEALPILGTALRDGRVYLWLVETTFTDDDSSPLEQSVLSGQYPHMQEDEEINVPDELWESLIAEIFRNDDPPRWVILFGGNLIFLCDRTKWGYGQYLIFDLDEIYGRREKDTLRAVAALLSSEALAPDDGIPLHDTLDENSHKHAYGVSQDLKYGVRQAVELLANEYVHYQRTVAKKALFQDEDLAQKLTDEALTYLYRLLFLFYAEARAGELNVVPMKSDAYRTGYSLEMLRDLELVPLNTPEAQNGYFMDETLDKLFHLVNDGYGNQELQYELAESGSHYDEYGFRIPGLHNPLFDPASTPLLSSVRFRNVILQEVIRLLSLSREEKYAKHGRGRISYAQLGINQLGAVYEGLLSFSGFFAQEDLFEVKSARDKEVKPDTQTYFIPIDERDRYKKEEFVYDKMPDGTRQRRRIRQGTFVFRMAGRNREKSASYYTPEVLTACVVKYSLKELLKDKTADEILELTICEPAMGSGAFINEALNQLADAYLERKQDELGERIPTDQYREERQKVKAYLAVNNAYGVDLNPTAVELARVSLWLNIIYEGAETPWFGPRLAVGNSLIGARRQVFTAEEVLSGDYAKKAPQDVPLGDGQGGFAPRPEGTVYHWLLPDEGMAAFDGDKVIKELAPDQVKKIKDWRKKFTQKIKHPELRMMQSLSDAADKLWEAHWRKRQTVLTLTRQEIPVWGQELQNDEPTSRAVGLSQSIAQKETDLARLYGANSPFRRLKLAMDYWCALWFWPLSAVDSLPDRNQFLNEMSELFRHAVEEFESLPEQLELFGPRGQKDKPLLETSMIPNVEKLSQAFTRFDIVRRIDNNFHFHHWGLVFPEVFIERLGFDLILGNPPWVKVKWSETGILSDFDPILSVRNHKSAQVNRERRTILNSSHRVDTYIKEFVEVQGEQTFLGASANYDSLVGLQINTYKCFLVKGWELGNSQTITGFLLPEGVYEDAKGGHLRSLIYPRLRSHFMFHNQLMLFAEIGDRIRYGINIYQALPKSGILFDHIVNLFHPQTIDLCYQSDGLGKVPGIKNDENHWDLTGHRNRIINIDSEKLKIIKAVFEDAETQPEESRLPIIHSKEILNVLRSFAQNDRNLENQKISYYSTRMWDETGAQDKDLIETTCLIPEDPREWIISGPHIFVANPLYQTPNEGCRSKGDYSNIDLVSIPDDYLPRAVYGRKCTRAEFEQQVPVWQGKKVTEFYRFLSRGMLSQAGERTLIPAIIPPEVKHIHTMFSLVFRDYFMMVNFVGLCASLPYDFFIKVLGKGFFERGVATILPIPDHPKINELIKHRILRLNCLTIYYEQLWEDLFDEGFVQDSWSRKDHRLSPWPELSPAWSRNVGLRNAFERRQGLIEIDVLAAMALELKLDELLTIYRVQFPVMQNYERKYLFDQRGYEVPVKTRYGELLVKEEDESFPEMVPPFTPVDREADYRQAWAHFTKVLGKS